MAHMTDLPFDILNVILVIIATSSDGARDLTRASATCKMLLTQARESDVLRVVNFRRLTFTTGSFRMHHHRKDLLCMCARAGNWAAHSILGKAILLQDTWFWGMILDDNKHVSYRRITAIGALHHHSLVRMFIRNATSQDIIAMRQHLIKYVITYAGYKAAREHGIIYAISDMWHDEAARLIATRNGSNKLMFGTVDFNCIMAWLKPRHEAFYRDAVIILFDKIFKLASD